jgi:hypothetical protein
VRDNDIPKSKAGNIFTAADTEPESYGAEFEVSDRSEMGGIMNSHKPLKRKAKIRGQMSRSECRSFDQFYMSDRF